jgi:hypothetical protein
MPGMPRVGDLSKIGFMGVECLGCTIRDDLMRAWGQAFRIPTAGRSRAQASIPMSCQPIAGYEREIFSAGCTMNIGSKKLLREVASTFCGAQSGLSPVEFVLHPWSHNPARQRSSHYGHWRPFFRILPRRLLSGTLVIQDITLGPFTNTHKLAMFGVFV